MRVDWIHPSWRDLVIDELCQDADRRRRFLEAAGVHGLLLALSSAGGASGARALPLLLSDADWDTVTTRVLRLAAELPRHELVALLAAVGDAPGQAANAYQRDEARALREQLLGRLARTWATRDDPTPVELIVAWYDARGLPFPDEEPDIAATFLSLAPDAATSLSRPWHAERVDDWLALAELWRGIDARRMLEHGFPERWTLELEAIGKESEDAGPVGRRIRQRLVRLRVAPGPAPAPGEPLAFDVHAAAQRARAAAARVPDGERDHVQRLLSDL